MTKKYTGQDIQVLSDIEHVRKRVPIYLGSNEITTFNVPFFNNDKLEVKTVRFVPAVYKAIGEIIDNSIDEFTHLPKQKVKTLTLKTDTQNGTYTIGDNGRGVPIDVHPTGKHTPEVVFGSLRSGRNFNDDEKLVSVIGQNGVGSSVTCFTSTNFEVVIHRDHKKYTQSFTNGCTKISTPKIVEISSDKTGTSTTFTLDPSVFRDIKIPEELMVNRAMEIALCNPGLEVEYNNRSFKYKKGFEGIIEKISTQYFEFNMTSENLIMQWFVIPNLHDNIDEQVFTWVNGSYLFDGGLCNTQFYNAFTDKVVEHLESQAKKMKIDITRNDVRRGLTIIGNVRVKNPQYDSQAKTRLTGPNTRNESSAMIAEMWSSFIRRNKDWLQQILDRAAARYNKDANKLAEKQLTRQSKLKIDNLRDATNKNRQTCRLFITEGLSASGQLTEVRNPETDAIFALTGKINNVYGTSVAELMKMGKVVDLIAAIGLVPGKTANRSFLRYGQICLMLDADQDGADIFSLLVNLFYQFWPELLNPKESPFIVRMLAPNIVASKSGKRVHFSSMDAFRKEEAKYKGWTIEYMKGLGSMSTDDWDMMLQNYLKYTIMIVDDNEMKATMNLLFGPDAQQRKEWLTRKV